MSTRFFAPIISLAIALSPLTTLSGLPLTEVWRTKYDGPAAKSFDSPVSMLVDSQQNVYITGLSWGNYHDYVTVKYNAQGAEMWAAIYDGPRNGHDEPAGLAMDGDGNVYVVGSSLGANGAYESTTIRYDPSGNIEWEARHPESRDEGFGGAGNAIQSDSAGNICIAGVSNGRYLVVKYAPDGHQLWTRFYAGSRGTNHTARALDVDSDGNVCVTGFADNNYGTIKYDGDGTKVWEMIYDSQTDVTDEAFAIKAGEDGHVYVTGGSGAPGFVREATTIKYSPLGAQLWTKKYRAPVSSTTVGTGLGLDGAGNVYVVGCSNGGSQTIILKYDAEGDLLWEEVTGIAGGFCPRAPSFVLDPAGYTFMGLLGESDEYLIKSFDPEGNEVWTKSLGPNAAKDVGRLVLALDPSAQLHAAGTLRGIETGEDIVCTKYTGGEDVLWSKRYTRHDHGNDQARAIVVNQTGEVHVGGSSGVVKYQSDGQMLWAITHVRADRPAFECRGIATDKEGSVYAVGGAESIKYDAMGSELWRAPYGQQGSSYASAVVVDPAQDVVVTGISDDSYLTVKYNSVGNELWRQRYSSPGGYDVQIAVDSLSNVVIAGPITESAGIITIKYDAQGEEVWALRYSGRGRAWPTAVAISNSGDVYVAGFTASGDTTESVVIKYAPSGQQLWAVRRPARWMSSLSLDFKGGVYMIAGQKTTKLDEDGNELWTKEFSGIGPFALAADDNGVHVAGMTLPPGEFGAGLVLVSYNSSDGHESSPLSYDPQQDGFFMAQDRIDRPIKIVTDGVGNVYVMATVASLNLQSLHHDMIAVKYVPSPGGLQFPSDANQDKFLDLSDAIWLLGHLFGGTFPRLPCEGGTSSAPGSGDLKLLDANNDTFIDISDVVYVLGFLFSGGPPPHLGTSCVRIEGCPDACDGG